MARGAHRAEGGRRLAGVEALDGGEARARGPQRRVPRARQGSGVLVEPAAAGQAEAAEGVDVVGRVDALDVAHLGQLRRHRHHLARQAGLGDALVDRGEALGPLRVARDGVVDVVGMGDEQHGHRQGR